MNQGEERIARFLISAAAAALFAAAILGAIGLRGAHGQPATGVDAVALTAETQEWCSSDQKSDPPFLVKQAGELWTGLARYSEDQQSAAMADPRWSVACALAFDLWALTDDQWNWCNEDSVRRDYLGPAIVFLGLGRDEAAGSESFGEAPGDNPAEYVQACRFAFQYWRDGIVGTEPADAGDAFLQLDGAEMAWCNSNGTAVDAGRRELGMAVDSGDSLAAQLNNVRACRFAYLVDLAKALPESIPPTGGPQPEKITYVALIVNRQNAPIILSDVANGQDYSQPVSGCSWMKVDGVTRELPWALGLKTESTDSDAVSLYRVSALSEVTQGSHVSLLVTVARTARRQPSRQRP